MKGYIKRSIEPVLKKAITEFPCVVLTGPRQAGKTTILKQLYGKKYSYVSLEAPDIRTAATKDPRGFIELYTPPIIFDEIQYAPDLLFYIKEKIDQQRNQNGQYILTGSQNILLLKHVTESLAGRTAILKLLPLSYIEMIHSPSELFIWEKEKNKKKQPISIKKFWHMMLRGCYPELSEHPRKDALLWHAGYTQTYLERDVRDLRQIGDLTQFQSFLRSLAARSAQLIQLSDIAKDLGIAVNTIKAWLAILEATYQIIILRPYHANVNKRLVKTPKIYFTDVGTLCYLTGISDPVHLMAGPLAGAVVETFVVSEIYKRLINRGIEPHVYFWRTASGTEVDLLVEEQRTIIPLEIKASATPKPAMADGIISLRKDISSLSSKGYVIHLGDVRLPLSSNIEALPFVYL